ncbi:hypothetical protein B0H13DRAFT_1862815 [Mycena leptocephala]|nr:hypothetical protein B0H13DRAFT_1862815 [Mycena leptocephala]
MEGYTAVKSSARKPLTRLPWDIRTDCHKTLTPSVKMAEIQFGAVGLTADSVHSEQIMIVATADVIVVIIELGGEILGRHPDSRWPVLISDSNVPFCPGSRLRHPLLRSTPSWADNLNNIPRRHASEIPDNSFPTKNCVLGTLQASDASVYTLEHSPQSIHCAATHKICDRAESNIIIVAGAFILSCIVLGVPTFGFYAIVLMPLRAQIYIRDVTSLENIEVEYAPGNKPFVLGNGDVDYITAAMGVEDERGNCSATWMWGAYIYGNVERSTHRAAICLLIRAAPCDLSAA